MPLRDDLIQPFHLNGREVRGRLVRLGPVADAILNRHRLPAAAASLLGEALALTAMVASALKFDGIFTLQAQGDGPANLLVADYRRHGDLRGYVRLRSGVDETRLSAAGTLLGRGSLALTIDREQDWERYQGRVELLGDDLASCAEHYFEQSEQLRSLIRLVAGRGPDGRWRAGGMMLQSMPQGADEEKSAEDWRMAQVLGETVTPQELLDPALAATDLLYRLFHEEGVWLHDPVPLADRCTCSAGRVREVVRSFPEAEVMDLVTDRGRIEVSCEFCGRDYELPLNDVLGAAS